MGCERGQHTPTWVEGKARRERRAAARAALDLAKMVGRCDAPKLMECLHCNETVWIACGTSMAERCVPCSRRYRRRWARVLRSGTVDAHGYRLFFLTLTAPGDEMHIDTRTGAWCECTPPGGVNPAEWNALLAGNWSMFMVYFRRRYGQDSQYAKAVEVQMLRLKRTGRGLLHLHVLIRCRTDVTHSVEELRRLAIRWGFGHSMKVEPFRPEHVFYLANYGTKACDDRQHIDLLDRRTGEIIHGPRHMRTFTCSRKWGETIGDVKRQQRAWFLEQQAAEAEHEARILEALRVQLGAVDAAPAARPAPAGPKGRKNRASLDSNTPSSTPKPAQPPLFAATPAPTVDLARHFMH